MASHPSGKAAAHGGHKWQVPPADADSKDEKWSVQKSADLCVSFRFYHYDLVQIPPPLSVTRHVPVPACIFLRLYWHLFLDCISAVSLCQLCIPSCACDPTSYGLDGWGTPYFKIGAESGHIEVDPTGVNGPAHAIDLYDLVQDLVERGHNLPLLIRFSGILEDRIRLLHEAFSKAIAEAEYDNAYRGVFPVKVCQQKHVIEEVRTACARWSTRVHHAIVYRPHVAI